MDNSTKLAHIRSNIVSSTVESEFGTRIIRSLDCSAEIPGEGKIGIYCPECVFNHDESSVRLSHGMVTHAGISVYYDNDGVKHSHDPNVVRADWTCRNGHAGTYSSINDCPVRNCQRGYEVLTTDPKKFKLDTLATSYVAREDTSTVGDKSANKTDNSTNFGVYEPAQLNVSLQNTNIGDCSYYTGVPFYFTLPQRHDNVSVPVHVPVSINTKPATDTIPMQITVNGRIYAGILTAIDE